MSNEKSKKKNDPKEKSLLLKLMDVAKLRGFLFQTADIYGTKIGGFYDFGPLGTLLKDNIISLWKNIFITQNVSFSVYEISGALVLPEEVLIASGHAESFNDPVVTCENEKCQSVLRADHVIEAVLGRSVESLNVDELNNLIEREGVKCPDCGSSLPAIETFNMMLQLNVGALKAARKAYLRPETAQSIFLNFKDVQRSMRAKLPFAICQVGKSFRNEISPRQGLIRMREFHQMEIENFIDPDKINDFTLDSDVGDIVITFIPQKDQLEAIANEEGDPDGYDASVQELLDKGEIINPYLAYYMALQEKFYNDMGIPHESIRFRHMTPKETPFYSKGNYDIEVNTSLGWKEVIGNAYRTDHDLTTHAKHSKTKLEYNDQGKKIVPHVVEPSFGVERAFYCMMEHAYREKEFDRGWAWFKFPKQLAPRQVHIYPLMKKPVLAEPAFELYKKFLKSGVSCIFDKTANIGKRYARADEIGTPYCITVDFESVEGDNLSYTIRDRDTRKQIRVPTSDIFTVYHQLINDEVKFEDAGQLVE